MANKIIRSICIFQKTPNTSSLKKLEDVSQKLISNGYSIQTTRLCSDIPSIKQVDALAPSEISYLSIGRMSYNQASMQLEAFLQSDRTTFNIDMTHEDIDLNHTKFLFDVIRKRAEHTFNFSYSFNTPGSSPFFTSTYYEKEGFSIGLQSPNLSEECTSLEEWFLKMLEVWEEICMIFQDDPEFLGIDSSVAPLFDAGSFIGFTKKLHGDFDSSVVSDTYTQVSRYIKTQNPKPIGLNGLMFPALEDSVLAQEYDVGNFSIERNIFLSLHSGLGIDTYPIGTDESPEKVVDILRLVQSLSHKYNKPLSVRFVSDGKTKIGQKTQFQNQYLKNITMRKL